MADENPTTLIERSGADWYFSFDTTHTPEYMVVTLRGKTSVERTETLLATIEAHLGQLTSSDGRFYPTIADLRDLPPPTLDSIKAGRAILESGLRRRSYLVVLVDHTRRRAALFGVLMGVLSKLAPNHFTVVTTMEAAQAEIQGYHQRQK